MILYPLSALYGALTSGRNRLYDRGWLPSRTSVLPTVVVGNLAVGGTGKTPHVEYLVGLLRARYRLATLSRGYGRRTRGFRLADAADTAETLGDEPLQMYQKFGPDIVVAVGEERVSALERLRECRPDVQVVLLDDAFQHRALRPFRSLLLTDFGRPFYEDGPLPGGRLRERRPGARRADAVVVTKCPTDLTEADRRRIEAETRRYTRPEVPIFFSTFAYADPVSLSGSGAWSEPVLLVSGLANAASFEAYARMTFAVAGRRPFPDHHAYAWADWARIRAATRETGARAVLTTEKDAVKMKTLLTPHELAECPVFYLPIAVRFLFGEGPAFDRWILEQIGRLVPDEPRPSPPDV